LGSARKVRGVSDWEGHGFQPWRKLMNIKGRHGWKPCPSLLERAYTNVLSSILLVRNMEGA